MFEVARYLPDLLRSFEAQAPGNYRLEYVFVDDGSPDHSGDLAEHWLHANRVHGCVIRQKNEGVSAARNRGLEATTGEWVTFPDPDDVLDVRYFRSIARFIDRHSGTFDIAAARLMRLYEPDPRTHDSHALDFRFAPGSRVVSLRANPDIFQLNVASAIFRRDEILASGVRFRSGRHASEDALFVAELLLQRDDPRIGLIADARYIYRKRETGDSAVDQFRYRPHTYWERFEEGYLPLMRSAAAGGDVPGWLQSMFLYECQWLLPAQLDAARQPVGLDEDGRRRTLRALGACAQHVSDGRLFAYDATALTLESRLLLMALAGRGLPPWAAGIARRRRPGWEVSVYARGRPEVRVLAGDGERLAADESIWATPPYFGQSTLHRWQGRCSRHPRFVELEGTRIPVQVGARGETEAHQRDRIRRRIAVGRWGVPSSAAQVRVWRPLWWFEGRPMRVLRWNQRVLAQWLRHTIRRVIRMSRGDG